MLDLPHSFFIHGAFDFLSILLAVVAGYFAYKIYFHETLSKTTQKLGVGYFIFLGVGSLTGSYVLGTLNLYLSGVPEIGRSILGALFGATMSVELYKHMRSITGSTGYIYIVPFCVCLAIGRLGCLFAGLTDNTYGTKTGLPWGWDFGDGALRHPVQLYESISMLGFMGILIVMLNFCRDLIVKYGYYLCVGFYALQRFFWEFLKPYQKLGFDLNLFQYVCIILILYGIVMIIKARNDNRAA